VPDAVDRMRRDLDSRNPRLSIARHAQNAIDHGRGVLKEKVPRLGIEPVGEELADDIPARSPLERHLLVGTIVRQRCDNPPERLGWSSGTEGDLPVR
jgi:hypothetical protein